MAYELRLSRLVAAVAAVACLLASHTARADRSIIKYPGRHPDYTIEAEPHLLLGPLPLPGPGKNKGPNFGVGPGFRGTFEIVDNGFISKINNTVGIGVGGDLVLGKDVGVWVPIVMQWNFFLSENWSVFGEPGGGLWLGKDVFPSPAVYAGGRFHFAREVTLTMRVGYPTFSIGLSFLL
jgi:hypothetical protein